MTHLIQHPNHRIFPADQSNRVRRIAESYDHTCDRLLGFLLSLSYEDLRLVTCDHWKYKCGGVPRNSFVIVKLNAAVVQEVAPALAHRIILARISEAVPTPVENDVQNMIFQVHKVQAMIDPMTNSELQWGALKATVLGTYYDTANGEVDFGNDVDSFLAPHHYQVYVPTDSDLTFLLNSFVRTEYPLHVGALRYTETPALNDASGVPILVDADDFIGTNAGHRTALFGKTRMGKSNAIKVIADTVLQSDRQVGQVILDPSGEYTYVNEQDHSSLYALHSDRCVRYSLTPRSPAIEQTMCFRPPAELRVNFFENVVLGHALINSLFDSEFPSRPGYMRPLLDWVPTDPVDAPSRTQISAYNHYWRTVGLYYALLIDAQYESPNGNAYTRIRVPLKAPIKKILAADEQIRTVARITEDARGQDVLAEDQPIEALRPIYSRVWPLYTQYRDDAKSFGTEDGSPYFNETEMSMLRILAREGNINGPIYLRPFRTYHSLNGSNVIDEIVEHVDQNKTVLIDYANAPADVSRNISERLCRAILARQMQRFAHNDLGTHFVLFYFEEAHTLFRADDNDLTSIYNKLAKEGAKFHIGMVYATQSMTTMSPDLIKNTENFIIAHLNDDREIKEVCRRYEFRDMGEDIQRCRSKGFVRLITMSHRFALPVQIRKFAPKPAIPNGHTP